MNKIKYIGFHHCFNPKLKKNFGFAATNKMDYVAKVLHEDLKFDVELISPSWYSRDATTISKQRNKFFNKIFYTKSLPTNNKYVGILNILFNNIWLLFFLLLRTKKNEKIIVYHSPWLSLPIIIAKEIRKFKLILEVEEIYAEVWSISKFFKKVEQLIINNADYFIVVSEGLGKMLPSKPKVVLYGSYWANKVDNYTVKNEKELKVVYCGAIDPYLGGAFNLVKSAFRLNDNISIHILGYGSASDLLLLNNIISEVNRQTKNETVKFHGLLQGKEFTDFLQGCDVGINPQNEGHHMNSAFPSKILTYFSNNLKVISTNVEGVKKSFLADKIIFTKDDCLESISNSLNNFDKLKIEIDNHKLIYELELNFIKELGLLIKNVK